MSSNIINKNNFTASFSPLSLDYESSKEYKDTLRYESLIFLLHYIVTIPVLLFIVSRLLRCLRRRGIISRGSEDCMFNECNRRLNRAANAPPAFDHTKIGIDHDSDAAFSSKASNATSDLEFPPLIVTSSATDPHPINKPVEITAGSFKIGSTIHHGQETNV